MSSSARGTPGYTDRLALLGCPLLVIKDRDFKTSWTLRYDIYLPRSPRQSDKGVLAIDSQENIDALRTSLSEQFIVIDQIRRKIFSTFTQSSHPAIFNSLDETLLQRENSYTIILQSHDKSLHEFLKEALPDPLPARPFSPYF